MNAPVGILAVEAPEPLTPATLGQELYEAARRGEVALSDHTGCWEILRHAHPKMGLELLSGAQRVAIDLAQHAARRPNAGLVTACRSAVAMLEAAAGGKGATGAELHAVLARVADVLDGALSLIAD